MSKKSLILSIPILVLAVLLGGWLVVRRSAPVSRPAPAPSAPTAPALPPLQPPTVPSTETGSGSAIDTSDWKTYRNEEYGFELKYPKEWVVFDDYPGGDQAFISLPENGIHRVDGVMIYMGSAATLVEEETKRSMLDGFSKVDSDQNIIFAGINARKIIRSLEIGRGSMQIFFKLNGVPFAIESTDLTDRNYYDSIISTLKFSR